MAKITVTPTPGFKYRLDIDTGKYQLVADQPSSVGGADGGPDPKELALAGLGACTAQTILMVAPQRNWDIQELIVKVSIAYQNDPTAGGNTKLPVITEEIEVKGNLTPNELDAIKRVAGKCPIYKLFVGSKRIDTSVVKTG